MTQEPRGNFQLGPIRAWVLDFFHGVAFSDDVYFYKLGGGFENEVPNGGLGIWREDEYAKALGYGQPTGIELPGEASVLYLIRHGNGSTWAKLVNGRYLYCNHWTRVCSSNPLASINVVCDHRQ